MDVGTNSCHLPFLATPSTSPLGTKPVLSRPFKTAAPHLHEGRRGGAAQARPFCMAHAPKRQETAQRRAQQDQLVHAAEQNGGEPLDWRS